MPNFQQMINAEIRRLARKEVKLAVEPIQKENIVLRRRISELEKKLKDWEKQAAQGIEPREIASKMESTGEKPVRITQDRIIKVRNKLGVTQAQFANLLGVSCHSVSLWESGRTAPRLDMKRQIANLRDLGKKELKALFATKGIEFKVAAQKAAKKSAVLKVPDAE